MRRRRRSVPFARRRLLGGGGGGPGSDKRAFSVGGVALTVSWSLRRSVAEAGIISPSGIISPASRFRHCTSAETRSPRPSPQLARSPAPAPEKPSVVPRRVAVTRPKAGPRGRCGGPCQRHEGRDLSCAMAKDAPMVGSPTVPAALPGRGVLSPAQALSCDRDALRKDGPQTTWHCCIWPAAGCGSTQPR
jgi:hypothetical protein